MASSGRGGGVRGKRGQKEGEWGEVCWVSACRATKKSHLPGGKRGETVSVMMRSQGYWAI